eukprot:GABV01009304.1.p1 GENE.GABV01009304.1~~GABV01009304.1.p1  ORF type:complete len:121 (+),score=8.70 GABV01009304.1:319-681(+)
MPHCSSYSNSFIHSEQQYMSLRSGCADQGCDYCFKAHGNSWWSVDCAEKEHGTDMYDKFFCNDVSFVVCFNQILLFSNNRVAACARPSLPGTSIGTYIGIAFGCFVALIIVTMIIPSLPR